jgi:hypothetical protein
MLEAVAIISRSIETKLANRSTKRKIELKVFKLPKQLIGMRDKKCNCNHKSIIYRLFAKKD